MTTQRADYLRRAIPRLREQYKPGGVIEWLDEVGGLILTPWQRQLAARWPDEASTFRTERI